MLPPLIRVNKHGQVNASGGDKKQGGITLRYVEKYNPHHTAPGR